MHAQTKPAPDVLVFTDGEKLIGELKSATGAKVVFKSAMGFEVTVEWSKIQELHSSQPFAAVPKDLVLKGGADAPKVPQGVLQMANQTLELMPAPAAPPQTIPVANVSNVVPEPTFERALHHQGIFEGWLGLATLGIGLTESTQQSTTITSSFAVQRSSPSEDWLRLRNKTLISFNQVYGNVSQKGSPSIKTEIYRGSLERDYYLHPRLFAYGSALFEHNFSQGLDLLQSYGGGLGYSVLKSERSQLDLTAGVAFLEQQFSTPGYNKKIFGSRFGETYRATFAHGIIFAEEAGVRPAWNHPEALFAGGTASLTLPVYRRLGVNAAVLDGFINDPPPGFRKNTFQLTIGASYTIK